MKKLSLCMAALSLTACAYAQKNTGDPQTYAKHISAEDARKHLSILASDAFEGRETGKPGAAKAANYIAGEFKKLGLQAPVNGAYFLDVPLTENSTKITLSVNGQDATNGKDFFASRGAAADKSFEGSDVVFIGYGTDAEVGNTDLTNKILLWVNEDKPEAGKTPSTSYRLSTARTQI